MYSSGTNAETLGGHPASYFATASNLQTVDDKADANRVLIDQLLTNANDKISFESVTVNVATIAANSNANITFTVPTKTGYTPKLALYGTNNKNAGLVPFSIAQLIVGTGATLGAYNTTNQTITNVTFTCFVLYEKNLV